MTLYQRKKEEKKSKKEKEEEQIVVQIKCLGKAKHLVIIVWFWVVAAEKKSKSWGKHYSFFYDISMSFSII